MSPREFFALEEVAASKYGAALLALWCEAREDWARAHVLAQHAGDYGKGAEAQAGCWVHAYLHRVEGDDGNAGYWYSRARRSVPAHGTSFEAERALIAAELLDSQAPSQG
jgi:hypothetical protein